MALDQLFNGHPIELFWESLGSTFIGSWIYILLILALDLTILVKLRQFEPVAFINLILVLMIKSYLPPEARYFVVLLSIMASVYSLITLFTKRG